MISRPKNGFLTISAFFLTQKSQRTKPIKITFPLQPVQPEPLTFYLSSEIIVYYFAILLSTYFEKKKKN